jgi:hypothetical protein
VLTGFGPFQVPPQGGIEESSIRSIKYVQVIYRAPSGRGPPGRPEILSSAGKQPRA